MPPAERELDDEIRSHLAISVRERIERGEDPEAARLAALREFGYIPAVRDSMRRVWFSRWFDALAAPGASLEGARVELTAVHAVHDGVRLAVGCAPRHLLTRVRSEGVQIAAIGIAAGAAGGYGLARVAASFVENVQLPGALAVLGAAAVLIAAAGVASLMPAARASRVDVLQALRSE